MTKTTLLRTIIVAMPIIPTQSFADSPTKTECRIKVVKQANQTLEIRGSFRNPDVIQLQNTGKYLLSPSGMYLAVANSSRNSINIGGSCYNLVVIDCRSGQIKGYEEIDCNTSKVNPGGVRVVNLRWREADAQLMYDIRAGKSHKDLIITIDK